MIAWLKRKIAWAVAGRELAELERWRVECSQTRRWLAEFDDVADALDHIESFVKGRHYDGLIDVREHMRRRRDATPLTIPPINMAPEAVDAFTRQWRAAYSAMPLVSLKTATLDQIESATELDAVEQYLSNLRIHEHTLFVDPPAPTHFTGIVPAAAKS